MNTLIGKKIGMTQVFDENGVHVPVTVVEVGPCTVVQRKTRKNDGYEAVQLGYEEQKPQRMTKPMQGHYKKAGATCARILREVRVPEEDEANVGDVISASIFEEVAFVDIIGTTKGRGFQGVVRKYRTAGGPASHGSGWHRRIGSVGQCEQPAKIFKNRKMPGQMGNARRTTQNLKVVKVRSEDNVILVRGSGSRPQRINSNSAESP